MKTYFTSSCSHILNPGKVTFSLLTLKLNIYIFEKKMFRKTLQFMIFFEKKKIKQPMKYKFNKKITVLLYKFK